MHLVTVKANNLKQAGFRYGKSQRQRIADYLRFFRKFVNTFGVMPWRSMVLYATPLLASAQKFTPEAWNFFSGMVEGSSLSATELFAANCFDLLENGHLGRPSGRRGASHCTVLLHRSREHAWLAGSEEWFPEYLPHLTLLTVILPRCRFSTLTFPAELGGYSFGGNGSGLAYSCTTLTLCGDGYGLPLPFTLFPINCTTDYRAYLAKVRNVVFGSSVTLNILDRKVIACGERRHDGRVFEVRKNFGTLAHANHSLESSPFFKTEYYWRGASQARQRRAESLLQKQPNAGVSSALEIMADTVWRYPIFTSDVIARCAVDAKRAAIFVNERSGARVELPLVSSGKQCGYEA